MYVLKAVWIFPPRNYVKQCSISCTLLTPTFFVSSPWPVKRSETESVIL